jgi:ABC-type oligopeptide transport system ATPase subunit
LAENIIEVQNLSKHFVVKRSFWGKPTMFLKAVDGVNLTIKRGETLGLGW